MSRIIVKNLPKNITESRIRSIFSEKGHITDVQLKYSKAGVFRQFAFIGFETEKQGTVARDELDKSYINTNRISVEVCEALSSATKPRSWSKYSSDSTAFQKANANDNDSGTEDSKKKLSKKEKLDAIIGEHKNDPKFIEFMEIHKKGRGIWENDLGLKNEMTEVAEEKFSKKSNKEEVEETESTIENKLANKAISDEEYMKSLRTKPSASSTEKSKELIDLLTIKMRNIPLKAKRQDVIKFFKPLKPYSIRLPAKIHGICYVGFKKEPDFKKAMQKDRSFWKGKQILISDFTEKNKKTKEELTTPTTVGNSKWAKQEEALRNEEDISESGRIFFRNLAYSTTDQDLRELFEKYGPVASVDLPIDPLTRIIKGFGTVTFMMPEHAVAAFNALDGSILHGRLLHLIPGKNRDEHNGDDVSSLSFKQQKTLKMKKSAGLSFNWNTLFLGTNAVADLLAKNYETEKEHILDASTGGSSAAVRLALGETEIILEMKRFLEENDVRLEVFDTEPKKRSNTVIIAKNLPANTTVKDIQPLFAKFGLLGRVILPPSGITALIEFLDFSEARTAFKKLAYSKFKNLPLYLEWAPENVFRTSSTGGTDSKESNRIAEEKLSENPENEIAKKQQEMTSEESGTDIVSDDSPPEPDTTIFLRNLNFSTNEDGIRKHFAALGPIHMIQVAMKKDPADLKKRLSLGYGFIQFKRKSSSEKALSTMQFTTIDGKSVELKRSDKILQTEVKTTRKSIKSSKQTGTKILVRNIPFQAKTKEIREIFQAFGEVKSVRLPKKMSMDDESHRGFGFVDYHSESDAKKAFDSLCQSTHLYGRRLVLEWAAVDSDGVDELRKRTAEQFSTSSTLTKKSRNTAVFDMSKVEQVSDVEDN